MIRDHIHADARTDGDADGVVDTGAREREPERARNWDYGRPPAAKTSRGADTRRAAMGSVPAGPWSGVRRLSRAALRRLLAELRTRHTRSRRVAFAETT